MFTQRRVLQFYCSSLFSIFGGLRLCVPKGFGVMEFHEKIVEPGLGYGCLKWGGAIFQ